MRKGIRGFPSADLIKVVNKSVLVKRVRLAKYFQTADVELILHAVGKWLMMNCKK